SEAAVLLGVSIVCWCFFWFCEARFTGLGRQEELEGPLNCRPTFFECCGALGPAFPLNLLTPFLQGMVSRLLPESTTGRRVCW
ncbi:hypothetical protein LEMLEM_LOCUS26073, partial [Lemmus lemmus]